MSEGLDTPHEVIDGIKIYPVDGFPFSGPINYHADAFDAEFCDRQLHDIFDFNPESGIYLRDGVPVTCGAIVDGIKKKCVGQMISIPTFVKIVDGRIEARIKVLS